MWFVQHRDQQQGCLLPMQQTPQTRPLESKARAKIAH